MSRSSRPFDALKRVIDVLSSVLGLTVLSPVVLVVGGLVALDLGRPVLFSQVRPGRDGRLFRMYKFRTMRTSDPLRGLVSDEQRLTRTGRFLRSTSLDELPELWNVLTGDMSLVGPRPLLVEYLERYTPEQARRHEVRPGITGLAQVRGRNALGWEEKFRIDVEYVENRSLALDLRILGQTVRSVVSRQGISHDGHATMVRFGDHDGAA